MFGRSGQQTYGSAGPRRRREGRGFGPFTSGHLTIIVVVVVLVVAFPFAAFAVTGNNVFVTDATSGNHASAANGRLKVDAGTSFGLVPTISQGGVVDVRGALPAKPIVTGLRFVLGQPVVMYGPVSKPFGITSLTITNADSSCERQVGIVSITSTGGNYEIEFADVTAHETLHFAYPTPLVVTPPAGGTASLQVNEQFNPGTCSSDLIVTAVGFQT